MPMPVSVTASVTQSRPCGERIQITASRECRVRRRQAKGDRSEAMLSTLR
jgi:hypothetical protein